MKSNERLQSSQWNGHLKNKNGRKKNVLRGVRNTIFWREFVLGRPTDTRYSFDSTRIAFTTTVCRTDGRQLYSIFLYRVHRQHPSVSLDTCSIADSENTWDRRLFFSLFVFRSLTCRNLWPLRDANALTNVEKFEFAFKPRLLLPTNETSYGHLPFNFVGTLSRKADDDDDDDNVEHGRLYNTKRGTVRTNGRRTEKRTRPNTLDSVITSGGAVCARVRSGSPPAETVFRPESIGSIHNTPMIDDDGHMTLQSKADPRANKRRPSTHPSVRPFARDCVLCH